MVLVEELEDDDVEQISNQADNTSKPQNDVAEEKSKTMSKGFLDKASEPLYPPEGSPEGKVDPNTHKAHTEHKMNQDMNESMNRGAKDNNGLERPEWYTKEWPKDCQYNSPGCTLHQMDTSGHASDLHKKMVRDNTRWEEALRTDVKEMRLSFLQLTDEDLAEVVEKLKDNKIVEELDLSHNKIKDQGIQKLVAALSAGAAPNLKELRVYSNEFGELGSTMLTQGLPIFRKKLVIHWKEASWAHIGRQVNAEKEAEKKEKESSLDSMN